MSDHTEKLGRWIGPSVEEFGGGDCHFILTETGKVHVTNSTRSVSQSEWNDRDIIRQMDEIDLHIRRKIANGEIDGDPIAAEIFDDDDSPIPEEPEASIPDADRFTPRAL